MGKRGPKPKPTNLRLLEGNPSRRPINHGEPRPTGDPVCPAHLSEDAKAVWRQIMESLPPGMISAADSPLFAVYCQTWAIHKAATEALQRERDLLGDSLAPRGRISPYVKIATEAARTMASLSTRLGLSPADRSGLKVGDRSKGSERWHGLIA